MVQLYPQEVCQDCGQDCAPVVQLHPQDVCRNCGQDHAQDTQLHPQDVCQDYAQEARVDHFHPRDARQDHVQDAQMDDPQVHILFKLLSLEIYFSGGSSRLSRVFSQMDQLWVQKVYQDHPQDSS